MEKKSPLEEMLQEILATEDFQRLEELKEPSCWEKMSAEECMLFSTALLACGEKDLQKGDHQALEHLELALKVSPNNSKILYRQAMVFISQECNMRWLNATCQALKAATEIDAQFFDAWCAWGCTLTRMGMLDDAVSYFEEANKKFQKAFECAENVHVTKIAEMQWQWGLSCFCHGKLSGEACDFYLAIEKYRAATESGLLIPDFFSDYGDALVEMAILLGKKELFSEAIELYRKSIQLAPEHFEGWLSLGCSFKRIYEYEKEDGYLNFANESFGKASELNANLPEVWQQWGELLMDAGKDKNDIELLKAASEKFENAYNLDDELPATLRLWAEALMLQGAILERIELLKKAESKIIKSLNIHSDDPESWYTYGSILLEIGRYFSDENFFLQAIEKYRYGLGLGHNKPLLWYGLALAYFAVGELCSDVTMIEQSLRHFSKAIEHGGEPSPQFWNDWGVALMQFGEMTQDKGQIELAIEKFERLIVLDDEMISNNCELEWIHHYASALDLLGNMSEDVVLVEKAIQLLQHVLNQDITYTDARYQLALAYTHLGELNDDVEQFHKANENFALLISEDPEDETSWNEWGLSVLNLAELTVDPSQPEKSKDLYMQAEEKFLHASALGCSAAFYNLTCLYSLMNNFSAAMHYMARAESTGTLPSIEEILHDDWLEQFRETQEFKNFISLLSTKQGKDEI